MAEVSLAPTMPVEERIPASAKFDKMDATSIIRGRRDVRWYPSTGTSVNSSGGSQIITFRLSDSNAYLDPLSCYLTFDLAITGDVSATTGGTGLDDTALSLFSRVKTEMNSVGLDDIVDVDSLAHSLIYSLGDRQAYEQDLGIQANSWKWNKLNYGGAAASTYANDGSVAAVQQRASVYYRHLKDADDEDLVQYARKLQMAIPLSLFQISLFKGSKFIPMRNLGIFTLNFYTNTANRALRTGVGAGGIGQAVDLASHAAGVAGFSLTNLAVVGQVLDMDARFLEVVDRVASTSETGLIMDFNTYTNLKQSYNATPTATDRSLVVSKATTSLRNMYIVRQPSAWRENQGYCGVTGFPSLGCTGVRLQISSLYKPEYGLAEDYPSQYNLGRQAHSLLGAQDCLGNTRVDGFANDDNADSDVNGQHVICFGFDRSANEYVALDGLSTISSGGTITVQLRDAGETTCPIGNTAVTFNSWVEFTRFLCLKQNAVSVVG